MGSLVDLIKRIGIFMIASQAVIHFTPEQKYGKYMKLIVSIMILLQFLTPVYAVFTGLEDNWDEWLSDISMDYSLEEMTGAGTASDALVEQMESEIKSKLNRETENEIYRIVNVRVSLKTVQEKDDNGYKQYALDNVRVVVMFDVPFAEITGEGETHMREEGNARYNIENGIDGIDKVQIQKISIGAEQLEEEEPATKDSAQVAEELREKFAKALGIEEKYMEVGVYGAVEETVE